MVRPFATASLILAAASVPLAAQTTEPAPVLRAGALSGDFHLDGRLDDPAWAGPTPSPPSP